MFTKQCWCRFVDHTKFRNKEVKNKKPKIHRLLKEKSVHLKSCFWYCWCFRSPAPVEVGSVFPLFAVVFLHLGIWHITILRLLRKTNIAAENAKKTRSKTEGFHDFILVKPPCVCSHPQGVDEFWATKSPCDTLEDGDLTCGMFWQKANKIACFPIRNSKGIFEEDRHSGRSNLLRTTAFCGKKHFGMRISWPAWKPVGFLPWIFERWLRPLELYSTTLGGGFKYLLFSPLFGEDSPFD